MAKGLMQNARQLGREGAGRLIPPAAH